MTKTVTDWNEQSPDVFSRMTFSEDPVKTFDAIVSGGLLNSCEHVILHAPAMNYCPQDVSCITTKTLYIYYTLYT